MDGANNPIPQRIHTFKAPNMQHPLKTILEETIIQVPFSMLHGQNKNASGDSSL